jgi:hypothetical protein
MAEHIEDQANSLDGNILGEATPARRLGGRTIDYLVKIKRPFQVLKGKMAEKLVFNIRFSGWMQRATDQKTDVEVTIVDATSVESLESQSPGVSLDSRRSSLPTELRLKIWRMCWEPRTVEVYPYINDRSADEQRPFSTTTYRSTAAIPVTLGLCSESRLETLKHYSLAFAALNKSPQIYFNFEIDRLYVREADMYRGDSFDATFDVTDLRRLRRLAIPDRYIQHLLGERARMPRAHPGYPPLSRLLLETRTPSIPPSIPPSNQVWDSLEEVNLVIDDEMRQRPDRLYSWIKEGVFVCAHCLLSELRCSLSAWSDGPDIALEACCMDGTRIELDPEPPERKPIVQRDGYLIFMPCCRLRADELLVALQRVDSLSRRSGWLSYDPFRIQTRRYRAALPCRCRLESYVLSQNHSPFSSRFHNFSSREVGELGRLCRKWLPETDFHGIPQSNY